MKKEKEDWIKNTRTYVPVRGMSGFDIAIKDLPSFHRFCQKLQGKKYTKYKPIGQ